MAAVRVAAPDARGCETCCPPLGPWPHPRSHSHLTPFPRQILGEQAILAANSPDLSTVALRPSGIFGEGDPIFVPTLVKQVGALSAGGACRAEERGGGEPRR